MIDVKQAAQSASDFVAGLYPATISSGARLEEVELSDNGMYWLITLSFPSPNALGIVLGAPRQYKIFKIDADTGKVLSMKIRETSNAAP